MIALLTVKETVLTEAELSLITGGKNGVATNEWNEFWKGLRQSFGW